MLKHYFRASLAALFLLLAAAPAALAQTSGVGIGTTAPDVSAALDIVSSSKGALLPRVADATAIATPATGLLVFQTGGTPGFYYNAGTPGAPSWQQLATAAGAAVTASNGLTKTGADIALGGALTGATTIAQAGNTFSLTGGNVGIGTSSPAGLLSVQSSALGAAAPDVQQLTTNSSGSATDSWQSFTATASGNLTQLDLRVSSPTGANGAPGTLSVYAGQGTGGALLTTQAIVYNDVLNTYQPYVLTAPVAVTAGQQYTYRFQTPTNSVDFVDLSTANPYAGGRCIYSTAWDFCFKTYVAPTVITNVLTALAAGNVGIGTATPGQKLDVTGNTNVTGNSYVSGNVGVGTPTPTQKLEVAGQVFSSTGGFRFPDNTVQTSAMPTATASNGLTKTGNNIALGGALTGATAIAQGGNNFSLMGGNVGIGTSSPAGLLSVEGNALGAGALDQQQLTTGFSGGATDQWQSFTAGISGSLSQLDLRVSSPTGANGAPGTLSVYAGQGTGGALLTTQAIVYNDVLNTYQPYVLTAPVAVTAGQQYTYRFQTPTNSVGFVSFSTANPYAGGRASFSATHDLCFKTYVAGMVTTSVLTALANGNVGIGTSAPRGLFDVNGPGDTYLVDDPNNGTTQSVFLPGHLLLAPYSGASGTAYVQARVPAPTAATSIGLTFRTSSGTALIDAFVLNANGSAVFAGPVTATSFTPSDARLKENIRSLGGALASVLVLRGVRYTYRHNLPGKTLPAGEQVGVLAQEVEALYPELVATGADGYKAVNYAQLAPVLIEAIKEQQTQLEELRAQVAAQASDHAALQAVKARAEADHADLQTLQAQMARLLGETTAIGTQARR